ncbi:beta-1,3-galactosyltransferase 5 [Amyelois transitella]|uniref:beta-1,3-galactosyltransferase 5 n=1 Tax=Amyelois transitella TaxID=680683 RepID=UPI00067B62EB|nr:beta-1,3-galactosyltransferase 5 [Amyelois transitella]
MIRKNDILTLHKYLIVFFTCLYFFEYYDYQNPEPPIVRIADPKFSLLGPYNATLPATDDVYRQLIDIKDFKFLLNPDPCKEYSSGLLLIVLVSSKPTNYQHRMVIRNTWGRKIDSTKVLFLLGEQNKSSGTFHDTYNESAIYGDVILGNFIDAYHNMTYKHVMGLKWVAHHCPAAKYVLKTDDDMVVNSHGLRMFLARQLSPWGARGLMTCQLLEHTLVQRSSRSKWRVSVEEFPDRYYPAYCAGWAILYSQDVVHKLLRIAQSIPQFWIDDVHITGTCAQMAGITVTPLKSLILTIPRAAVLTSLGPNFVSEFLFGPTDISPKRMTKIWKAIPSRVG